MKDKVQNAVPSAQQKTTVVGYIQLYHEFAGFARCCQNAKKALLRREGGKRYITFSGLSCLERQRSIRAVQRDRDTPLRLE